LRLAYFGAPGLPRELERIPLEYFVPPLEWLGKQRGVDPEKVVTIGTSRGGELALVLASRYPRLVHGAVGYVPNAHVSEAPGGEQPAWTVAGEPVPYAAAGHVPPADAAIAVERISGPVLVIGAGQDGVWPSRTSVEQIAARMRDHGRRDVTAVTYPSAGHGVGAMIPNVFIGTISRTRHGDIHWGGTPEGDAVARAAAWKKLLAYLTRL